MIFQRKCEYSRLHSHAFLTTTPTPTPTITTITPQQDSNPHAKRVGALWSHPPECGYTPVGPGKDTHGTRGGGASAEEGRGWPDNKPRRETRQHKTQRRRRDQGCRDTPW